MASEIVSSSNPHPQATTSPQGANSSSEMQPANHLGDRLDSVIGETSSGIGALLSELLRRSLKSGVTDLGDSLGEFADEQVEMAVERQMPVIAEAADAVAESTSKRVVQAAIDELNGQTAKAQEAMECKIDEVESKAFDRSKDHVNEVVREVRETIEKTREDATASQNSSETKIEELREKARQSWRKLVEEITKVKEAHNSLVQKNDKLREELGQVYQKHLQQVEAAEQRYAALLDRNQVFEMRLAALEKPKGIKAVFAKFRGKGKSQAKLSAPAPESDPSEEG